MAGRLENRVAVVTGGGRGIGRAICRVFAEAGARVAVVDVDGDMAADCASDLATASIPLVADISSPDSSRRALSAAADHFGGFDILVNNAGMLIYTTVFDCDEEAWDRVLDVNLKGTFFCAQAAIPHLQKRGGGAIVSMSSLAAKSGGMAAGPPYAAAKAGIHTLTITLAKALAPHRIRVNGIAPGVIDTDMTRGLSPGHANLAAQIPLGEKGTPEDVAHCALFLASEEARHITGEIIDVNGGLHMD